MSKTDDLTPNQRAVLEHALDRTDGRMEWFPPNIKGGARAKMLASLKTRGLARERGKGWAVTQGAAAALGRATGEGAEASKRLVRTGSKQAQVIALMKRPEGATNRQIQALTEWQPHTVRGFIAGTLRKKLQLAVEAARDDAGDLVYRIK